MAAHLDSQAELVTASERQEMTFTLIRDTPGQPGESQLRQIRCIRMDAENQRGGGQPLVPSQWGELEPALAFLGPRDQKLQDVTTHPAEDTSRR